MVIFRFIDPQSSLVISKPSSRESSVLKSATLVIRGEE